MNRRRRELLRMLLGAGTIAGTGSILGCGQRRRAVKQPHVVVVGGGFGGAGCARYLKYLDPDIRVTLIEPKKQFVTCPFSNLFLGGLLPYEDLIQPYTPLSVDHSIHVVHTLATRFDPDKRILYLKDGKSIGYDRLVVSPGISMHWNRLPENYTSEAVENMPHAWIAGKQTRLLRRKLTAMKNGGLVAISVPPAPFRCPPGPFERASLMAHYLSNHKPRSKILVLNANSHFSKEDLFQEAWEELYAGLIEYRSISEGGLVHAVSPGQGYLHTEGELLRPDVANVIPAHGAGSFAVANDLTDQTGWCPVDHRTFESERVPNVHILGDSCLAGAMPKSASSANSQAKACSLALVALLRDEEFTAPVYHNTCYSLAAPDYGFSVNGMYRYKDQRITLIERAGGLSPLKASREFRRREAHNARDWYNSITADTFGTYPDIATESLPRTGSGDTEGHGEVE